MHLTRSVRQLAAASILLSLTACGGGEGGTSGVTQPPPAANKGSYFVDPSGQCAGRSPCYTTLYSAVVDSFKSQFELDLNGRVARALRPNDPPDLITVMPGIYRAASPGKWVLLLGQNGEDFSPARWKLQLIAEQGPRATIITGENTGPCILITDDIDLVLSGFTITQCSPANSSSGGEQSAIYVNSYTHARVHLTGNRIIDNPASQGLSVQPYYSGFNDIDMQFSRNLISGNKNGLIFEQFPLVDSRNLARIVVANNLILANNTSSSTSDGRGIVVGPANTIGGAFPTDSIEVHIVHNTVVGNSQIGLLLYGSDRPFNIQNNIVHGNPVDIFGGAGPITLRNNLVGEVSQLLVPGAGNRVGNPMFVNAGDGVLDLGVGSSAIDAGATLSLPEVQTDFRGTHRPTDGDRDGVAKPDIGAIELSP